MNRRRSLLVQSTKSQLPAGYKRVEYLQTDQQGNAYIDTQYIYDIDSLISCEYLFNIKNDHTIFGIRSPNYKIIATSTGYGLFYARSTNNAAASISINVSTKYQIWQEPKRLAVETSGSQQVRYIDTDDNYKNETNASLFIFTDNRNGSRGERGPSLRIYSFSITKNNKLVVNLVPCKDNNNVPCFYDTVRKITLYNSSTSGEFITGDEV